MAPYVSFVAAARNDDHGGNLLHRMQLFVDGLSEQCKRHKVEAELVLVEWNPPKDKSSLADVLHWDTEGPLKARVITVPETLHSNLEYSDRLPFFQMIAKNVGIRRARGEFIVATNVDLLFNDQLFSLLAGKRLRENRLYRVDRYDVREDVPLHEPFDKQLRYCEENVIRICSRIATIDLRDGRSHLMYQPIRYLPRAMERWARAHLPTKVQDWWKYQEHRRIPTARVRLHTNTAGDFTLLSRKKWFELRGYPELEIFSLHIDALFSYIAHYGGAREKILRDPVRIYHVEHATGWKPEVAENPAAQTGRLDPKAIPQITMEQFEQWAYEMRRERKPKSFNSEDWGIAGEELTQTLVT